MSQVRYLLLFTTIALVSFSMSMIMNDSADASTTYVVGEWRIEDTTVLEDGVWDVSGSIVVVNCTLTLDNASIIFNSTSLLPPMVRVLEDGRLESFDSILTGGSKGFRLELFGDASFTNSTISTNEHDPEEYGIWQLAGDLAAHDCTFSNARTLLWAQSGVDIEGCMLSDFSDAAVEWHFQAGAGRKTVIIEDSVFQNERHEGQAISIRGPRNEMLVRIVVSNNTFKNTYGCVYCSDFLSASTDKSPIVLVENNTAEMCTNAIGFTGSSALVARRNRWHMVYSPGFFSTAHIIIVYGEGSPSISDDEIIGGRNGIMIDAYDRPVVLSNISISDVDVGITVQHAKLIVRGSRIYANVHDFELQGLATVRLYDCNHSFNSNVFGSGAVYDIAVINVTSVTWQEGTPIDSGFIIFDDGAGNYLSKRDNHSPSKIDLPVWILTQTSEMRIDHARGAYQVGNVTFYSEPFKVRDVQEIALIIYDWYAPVLAVTSPSDGVNLRTGMLLVWGSCSELGSGMGSVKVRCTGTAWQDAELVAGREWRLILLGLGDGVLSVTVNATDRAGNSMQIDVGNITIDTVRPLIEVLNPPRHVRTTPVELIVRTEPGSTAHVDDEPVVVIREGRFSTLLSLHEGENSVLITIEDAVGNRNETVCSIILDTVPPTLRLTSPDDGRWTRDDSVWVNGTTDPGAHVSVEGIQVIVSPDGSFSVQVAVVEDETVISISAVDEAGNAVRSARRVRSDHEAPMLEILAPIDGDKTDDRVQTIVGRVADASPFTVHVEEQEATLVGDRWFGEILLEDGPNLVRVEAVDAAGNVAVSSITVMVDTRHPSMAVKLMVGGHNFTSLGVPITTGDAEALFELITDEHGTVEVDGRETFTIEAGRSVMRLYRMVEGMNAFRFSVWDDAGNVGTMQEFNIELDTVAPSLIMLIPEDGMITKDQFIIVRGFAEDGVGAQINGVVASLGSDGSFEAIVPLRMGTNPLLIVAWDAAHNSMSTSVNVIREEGPVSVPSRNVDGYLFAMAGLILGLALSVIILRLSTRNG